MLECVCLWVRFVFILIVHHHDFRELTATVFVRTIIIKTINIRYFFFLKKIKQKFNTLLYITHILHEANRGYSGGVDNKRILNKNRTDIFKACLSNGIAFVVRSQLGAVGRISNKVAVMIRPDCCMPILLW